MSSDTSCALEAAPVWTDQELIGWNGMACAAVDSDGAQTESTGGVIVTLPTPR